MQCTNNMKQIGLAMHNYHSAFDVFPPTGSVDVNGNSGGSGAVPQTASIHLRLLNYLEHEVIYNAYNFKLGDVLAGSSVPANTTVMATNIAGYLCPSDPNPGNTGNLAGGFSVPVTCINYAINAGTNRQYSGGIVNGVAWWLGGNASYGNRVNLASITDGTTNTAAFSEWVKGKSGQNARGKNLVYSIARYNNGSSQNDYNLCSLLDHRALGLQGRVLDPAGHRARRSVLSRHDPEQAGLCDQHGLRQRRLVHRPRLLPPRRREPAADGRVGPVRQGRRGAEYLERPGDPGRERGDQLRCALTAVDRSPESRTPTVLAQAVQLARQRPADCARPEQSQETKDQEAQEEQQDRPSLDEQPIRNAACRARIALEPAGQGNPGRPDWQRGRHGAARSQATPLRRSRAGTPTSCECLTPAPGCPSSGRLA